MNLDQLIDHSIHVAEILPLIGLVWRASRKFSRYMDIMMDFPPHRHSNGQILYPRDFSPGRVERRSNQEEP